MRSKRWRAVLGVLAGVTALLMAPPARAACTEDARRITLDKDNQVRLKGYTCRIGERPDAPEIKIEVHRFSEIAAGLIVAKRSSVMLTKTIGTPKVVENEVFKSYAEILQKFGSTFEMEIAMETPEGSANDRMGKGTRTLPAWENNDYPAVDEIIALRKKAIPAELKFFYSVGSFCEDEYTDKPASRAICKKYDPKHVDMLFWRPLRSEDIANYSQKVKAYNGLLTRFKTELRASGSAASLEKQPMSGTGLPDNLKLFQFIAGSSWPEDFSWLVGYRTQACGTNSVAGIDGWEFRYTGRKVFLEALVIQNLSTKPVSISEMFGSRAAEPRLRPVSLEAGTNSLGELNGTLAAGQRLLVPTRIIFAPEERGVEDFRYTQTARDIFAQRGSNGYRGNTALHEAPRLRDYVYGPELAVGGMLVDGTRVSLSPPVPNFTVLAITGQIGSCPYLMSWDARDRGWIEHGKVLHRAQGAQQAYAETIVLPGFRQRFRLEEREAEMAFIDQAELSVVLRSGGNIRLKPHDARLAARDGNSVRLLWGESIEFAFKRPRNVAAADVIESRLMLTGHYDRYADLQASADASMIPTPETAALCPAPGLVSAWMGADRLQTVRLRWR